MLSLIVCFLQIQQLYNIVRHCDCVPADFTQQGSQHGGSFKGINKYWYTTVLSCKEADNSASPLAQCLKTLAQSQEVKTGVQRGCFSNLTDQALLGVVQCNNRFCLWRTKYLAWKSTHSHSDLTDSRLLLLNYSFKNEEDDRWLCEQIVPDKCCQKNQ